MKKCSLQARQWMQVTLTETPSHCTIRRLGSGLGFFFKKVNTIIQVGNSGKISHMVLPLRCFTWTMK